MRKFISNDKDIARYVKTLMHHHGAVLRYGSKHPYLILYGKRITIPSSPSCKKAFINFQNDIKRHTGKK